ncbi:vesicle-associated membrane protein 721 [Prunus yedoensis var. nudiflora]|uniref:Vesicle-associated membrane protein 721 n=1 Tax=Prunus yedoensis var. nudiflora TaxID=2094558 RepID=A0A314ZPD3_PRUYE|nr:vesicle-associated membrane protein 721 [Prunus yedoensis var. nudiflora]
MTEKLLYVVLIICFVHFTLLCSQAEVKLTVHESSGRQVPIAFLERIKDDFVSKYGGGKAATAPANSLNKEFGYHT